MVSGRQFALPITAVPCKAALPRVRRAPAQLPGIRVFGTSRTPPACSADGCPIEAASNPGPGPVAPPAPRGACRRSHRGTSDARKTVSSRRRLAAGTDATPRSPLVVPRQSPEAAYPSAVRKLRVAPQVQIQAIERGIAAAVRPGIRETGYEPAPVAPRSPLLRSGSHCTSDNLRTRSTHQDTAVDLQHFTGDISRFLGCQKLDGVRHI